MRDKAAVILCLVLISAFDGSAAPPNSVIKTGVVTISVEQQYEAVLPGGESALAIHFELEKDWHFYASAETAPGGMNLKIKPPAEKPVNFSEPIFPPSHLYFDKSLNKKLEVFSDRFIVYLPFSVGQSADTKVTAKIGIEGAVCSDIQCRMPNFGYLSVELKIDKNAIMGEPKFVLPEAVETGAAGGRLFLDERLSYPIWFALGLALIAGLSLNIMPCVWPVLPLVVLRLVGQAKKGKGKTITMGLAFCVGILLFFASLAAANIVLQLLYGTALQWGDQFRNPVFVTIMALLMVVLALFMFDVFTITLPASVTGKSSGQGYVGTVGMGFLAAILSTPCSFGILAAAFAWAQGQPLLPATVAIMFIGVGMSVPYLILTLIPGLLEKLPRPGRWMELFKQTVGFILLGIAAWMITVVPQAKRAEVLYFAVVLAFCVWMWGGWVSYNTKALRKWFVRLIAVALAVVAGWGLLKPAEKLIDWQGYDGALIDSALSQNRPVLVKFTADWCLSCKTVDKWVYSRKDIASLIKKKGVLAIKADTTAKDYPATQALKNIYKEPGVPVSMYFTPGETEPLRWRDKRFGDELKALLEELPSQ
ncbi:MAG: thioredoxin family protein [Planctomycetota bacterium]|nr:MAG: thioredoxin family protein [Planctomycetota bacterium]